MAYELIDQYNLDINWYFVDKFKRICVAASAGGILPTIVAENDQQNNRFHEIVSNLPERYETRRNEQIITRIQGITLDTIEQYFESFESLARKGLYVFDRLNISDSQDSEYFLVAYPIYNPRFDLLPFSDTDLSLIPRIDQAIGNRTVNPFDLIKYFG